ncbi:chemotaxis protein CheX [Geoalkalibacter halelectricus]|uniref:Chemotaxis protein CheX n=1 Tax=Geoalkalibacter halelectricus TaxID=2847045 RepID=A0ABY5ZGV0_9BACT|nr:chemotaxis protein CheX [Geoalkalibacter halelectricus]MDO3378094.1 chemotaxis protein CheX [Geoalkalibacter halelectricus]UWZ78390.1 chemotaxis protein CheX [Geoalkalibacter halelectricus]
MDLAKTISEATREIFETMIMAEVIPGEPRNEGAQKYSCTVSGMVGLAGLFKGMIAIHTPDAVAMSITSSFLGMDVEEVNDDVTDAIGELANMLAGSVKMALSQNGKDITLSIPSTITGEEYSINCILDTDRVIMPFTLGEGQFLVELQVEKQA